MYSRIYMSIRYYDDPATQAPPAPPIRSRLYVPGSHVIFIKYQPSIYNLSLAWYTKDSLVLKHQARTKK